MPNELHKRSTLIISPSKFADPDPAVVKRHSSRTEGVNSVMRRAQA
jgi:hypothetical protein